MTFYELFDALHEDNFRVGHDGKTPTGLGTKSQIKEYACVGPIVTLLELREETKDSERGGKRS